jgi:hypothetical protein
MPCSRGSLVTVTERCGRVDNTRASYSEGPGFKSRPGDGLSWARDFVFFPSSSRRIPGLYLRLCNHRFLPHLFQFIIHYHPFIRRYVVWVIENASWNKIHIKLLSLKQTLTRFRTAPCYNFTLNYLNIIVVIFVTSITTHCASVASPRCCWWLEIKD